MKISKKKVELLMAEKGMSYADQTLSLAETDRLRIGALERKTGRKQLASLHELWAYQ